MTIIKKYPEIKWCMIGNSLYDFSNWQHPGGNYLIEKTKGRDCSAFFFDGYGLEEYNKHGYIHSQKAETLLRKFQFGEVNF